MQNNNEQLDQKTMEYLILQRAKMNPAVLEIFANCAESIHAENSEYADDQYSGSDWLTFAAGLRAQAASLRIQNPEQGVSKPIAYRLMRLSQHSLEWINDGLHWIAGLPPKELVEEAAQSTQWKIEYAYGEAPNHGTKENPAQTPYAFEINGAGIPEFFTKDVVLAKKLERLCEGSVKYLYAEPVLENTQALSTQVSGSDPSEPPLTGRWHHGSGVLVSGGTRIARWDCDSNANEDFRNQVMDWMCTTLNLAVNQSKSQFKSQSKNRTWTAPNYSHCQSEFGGDVCLAGNKDGICCPPDSCDIDDGIRPNPCAGKTEPIVSKCKAQVSQNPTLKLAGHFFEHQGVWQQQVTKDTEGLTALYQLQATAESNRVAKNEDANS